MGTIKDPRKTERKDQEKPQDVSEQEEEASAQPKPETPEYKITDWASF